MLKRRQEGEIVLSDMEIGIVQHFARQKTPPVQALHVVPMESDAVRGTAEIAQNRTDARKQLQVQDRVDPAPTKLPDGPHSIRQEYTEAAVPQEDVPFLRRKIQYFRAASESFKHQEVEDRFRVPTPQSFQHRIGEDQAPHFRDFNDQDVTR